MATMTPKNPVSKPAQSRKRQIKQAGRHPGNGKASSRTLRADDVDRFIQLLSTLNGMSDEELSLGFAHVFVNQYDQGDREVFDAMFVSNGVNRLNILETVGSLKQIFGKIHDRLQRTIVKIEPADGTRLKKENIRIRQYSKFNQIVSPDRLDYNPVPTILGTSHLAQQPGYLVIERVDGERLYEHLATLEKELRSVRGKKGIKSLKKEEIDEINTAADNLEERIEEFWDTTIERVVRSQAASLYIEDDYVDKVHSLDPEENARFYVEQLNRKFIGNRTSIEKENFKGGLISILDRRRERDNNFIKNLRQLIKKNYYPIAYIIGQAEPGIDCDRSLWNIIVRGGNQYMIDFETLTDSPHAIALANATEMGVKFDVRKREFDRDMRLNVRRYEVKPYFRKGQKVSNRTYLRFMYCSLWNKTIQQHFDKGVYDGFFDQDEINELKIADFEEFEIHHAAAGVQRPLVHFGTFVKTLRNALHERELLETKDKDKADKKVDLAYQGILNSITFARENIGETLNNIAHRDEYAEFRGYIPGVRELDEELKNLRKYLKAPKTRSRVMTKLKNERRNYHTKD